MLWHGVSAGTGVFAEASVGPFFSALPFILLFLENLVYGKSMKRRTTLHLTLVASLILMSTGCATNAELRRVQDQSQSAQRIADQALIVAQEANGRSLRTEETMDRCFRRSMKK